jgi:hypothetical protein
MEKKGKPSLAEQIASELSDLMKINQSIALDRSPNSILSDESTYKEKSDVFLKKLYDFLANEFGYRSIDHMISVAHTLLLAKTIANPSGPTQGVMKSIEQIQENIRPKGDLTQGKMSKGDSKNEIIKNMEEHFSAKDKPLPS